MAEGDQRAIRAAAAAIVVGVLLLGACTDGRDEPRAAPWFVGQGAADGLWRLDLLTMQRAIRFDTRNRWRLAEPAALGPFAFAFVQ